MEGRKERRKGGKKGVGVSGRERGGRKEEGKGRAGKRKEGGWRGGMRRAEEVKRKEKNEEREG